MMRISALSWSLAAGADCVRANRKQAEAGGGPWVFGRTGSRS